MFLKSKYLRHCAFDDEQYAFISLLICNDENLFVSKVACDGKLSRPALWYTNPSIESMFRVLNLSTHIQGKEKDIVYTLINSKQT